MEKIFERLEKVRTTSPLVHHITNYVTVENCANITKFFGGSPVMADAKEEAADMTSLADALVLNIGTLNAVQIESMKISGAAANKKGIPVILDVCGAGATKYRNDMCAELLKTFNVSVLKGNLSEIAAIAGLNVQTKGVDSVNVETDKYALAKNLAANMKNVVVITGPEDVISDGKIVYSVKNGDAIMGKIVGTGCMATSVIGTFCAVEKKYAIACASALVCFEIAAENAETTSDGPGTFMGNFFDKILMLSEISVNKMKQISEIKVNG